ncbi:ArdC family protein [Echinicola rosea]|uniref:Antirestriction protein n=1 Tax=Echinicola rosea TaxID=1807691 RepID=A0ABQ1UST3_9BACT|nr:zincin-like metallopeptidase domain-containing protein [Echinicola rosea]GGF24578.1 antirestriction protein [Echinicola rosea]
MKRQSKNSRKDVYQIVNERIMAGLEKGVVPWKQPWSVMGLPKNYRSGKTYRGINLWLLLSCGHAEPYYLTFKQAESLGGKVKKGSRSIPVVYWNVMYRHKETGKKLSWEEAGKLPKDLVDRRAFLKYYNVFHIGEVEGVEWDLPETVMEKPFQPIKACEELLEKAPDLPGIRHGEAQAYYHPGKDYINMPKKELFRSEGHYYQTLYHEVVHGTGHQKRLDRKELWDTSNMDGTLYAREELIAEMGASYLGNLCGIWENDLQDNSSAYIQHWLSQLKNDKRLLVEAAGKAQKAVDYLTGKMT